MNTVLKSSIRNEKNALRLHMPKEQHASFSATITARIKPHIEPAAAMVATYYPMRGEVDISLLEYANTCLPVIVAHSRQLIFRKIHSGQKMERGIHNTMQPPEAAIQVIPDILIVPTLAFDRRGSRIGAGGGYYDVTLRHLRAQKKITAIGIAFACQEVAEVPTEAFDEKLDMVITEKEILHFV